MTNVDIPERFRSKVDFTNACWLWLGATTPQGHGVYRGDDGRNLPAHHYTFRLTGAVIPAKIRLLHRCGNPSCVKPGHLFLGTPENMLRRKLRRMANGCIEWTGSLITNGYGLVGIGGRIILTHRLAYELAHGPIPGGQWVLHHCDSRRCCNPDHLFLGNARVNRDDCVAKGREARGEILASSKRGERNPRSKLKAADVVQIRVLANEGTSQRVIARRYRIDQATVSMIVRRRTWKHI